MLSAVTMAIRMGFGIILGVILGAAGVIVGLLVAPPGPSLPGALIVICCGAAAGIGGFVSFYKLEAPPGVNRLNVAIALAGGLIGAWAGWNLGPIIYPDGIYNPAAPFRTPPFIVPVMVASVGTNVFAWGFYVYRLFRFREI